MASKKKQPVEVITSFKGFNKDWQCRGYQFKVGKTFQHEGEVKACAGGFHSCEYPLDVFGYYAPYESRFAVVKASGQISRDGDDSKIASATLSIEAEITIPQMVSKAVDWIMDRLDTTQEAATNTGNQSEATNTGNQSAATNTGNQSAATNTGDYSAATNTGDRSAATNTGYQSAATNTGDYSAATNTGNRSAATNTGNQSAATNTGNRSAATNTGYRSAAEVSGRHAVAASFGEEGRARASEGGAIVLCYRNDEGELLHIRASKVGENGIEPDAWYSLSAGGEFVKIE